MTHVTQIQPGTDTIIIDDEPKVKLRTRVRSAGSTTLAKAKATKAAIMTWWLSLTRRQRRFFSRNSDSLRLAAAMMLNFIGWFALALTTVWFWGPELLIIGIAYIILFKAAVKILNMAIRATLPAEDRVPQVSQHFAYPYSKLGQT